MGKRRKSRKRALLRPRKRIPKIFTCPNCGNTSVIVKPDRKGGMVRVVCGECGIGATYEENRSKQTVDYYNAFVDDYYSGRVPMGAKGASPGTEEVEEG